MAKGPRRRWPRIFALLAAIGTLSAAVALVLYVRSDDFQKRAKNLLEWVVESQTHKELTLGAVHVEFWPPAATLQRVNLWDPGTGETFVSAENIRAPLVLTRHGVGIGQLQLDNPVIALHIGPEGEVRELAGIPRQELKELPFQSLLVTEGAFHLWFQDGEVALSHVYVNPVAGPIEDISAELALQVNDLEAHAPIRWQRATIGPDRIVVPSLGIALVTDPSPDRLSQPVATIDGSFEIPFEGELDGHVTVSADADVATAAIPKPTALHGSVQLDATLSGTKDAPVLDAAVLGQSLQLDLFAKGVRGIPDAIVHHRFETLSAAFEATPDGLDIERATLWWGEGTLTVWGKITKQGEIQGLHVLAEDLSLAHVLWQLDVFQNPYVDFRGDVDLVLDGTLNPFKLEGPFDIAMADFVVASGPVREPGQTRVLDIPYGEVAGKLTIEPTLVTLDCDTVTSPRGQGTAIAKLGLEPGPIDIRFDIPQMDFDDLRPLGDSLLRGKGHVKGRIWGPGETLQLAGKADVVDFGVNGFPYADHLVADIRSPKMEDLWVENAVGTKGRTTYTGDFRLDLSENTAFDLELDIPDGRVEDIDRVFLQTERMTGKLAGHMSLHGPVYDLDGESELRLADVEVYGEQFESGDGRGRMNQGVFELDHLVLRRGDEEVRATGGVKRAYAMDFEVAGKNLRLERLTALKGRELPVRGALALDVHVGGTLQDPAPSGTIRLDNATYQGGAPTSSWVRFVTSAGVASYDGRLVNDTIGVRGTIGLWEEQPYDLVAALTDAPVHLLYPTAADGTPIEAVLSGGLHLAGHFGEHPSPVDIVADATKFAFAWRDTRLANTGRWHYEQHGDDFLLEDFGLEGARTRFRLDAAGGLETLSVNGKGKVDTDLLRVVVPGLQRADGTADVTVTASGRPPDVATVVDVTLDAPLVRHESFPGTFEDVHAVVHATRDQWRLEDASATLGGGAVSAVGRLDVDNWRPERILLTAHGQNTQVRWVDWLPPAIVTADLTFDGPMNLLLLSGDVRVDDMTFSDRIDWEDWVVEWQDELLVTPAIDEAPGLFSLDIGIRADRTIRLRNNVADGYASADLRVIGDTSRPGLVGTVTIEDSVAYLRDREFRVDRGEIAFRDPWTWDPDLDFELVTDITSRDRRYRVKYLVSGPFSNWKADTRSDPALPQADVNALLWFGVTADDLEGMGGLSQAIGGSVADMLLSDFLVTNQAASELRSEFTMLDRVDLVTGIDARGEYSSDPRLRVEKRFSDLNDLSVIWEVNVVRGDQFVRGDYPISDAWSLSAWYASRQRDRSLEIGGAYGVDLRARWEMDGR